MWLVMVGVLLIGILIYGLLTCTKKKKSRVIQSAPKQGKIPREVVEKAINKVMKKRK